MLAIAGTAWGLWRLVLPVVTVRLARRRWMTAGALAAFVGPLGPLTAALLRWADPAVRGDGRYIALFLLAGVAAQTLVLVLAGLLGIRWRDDVIERRNPAALAALAGALLGWTLLYAGSNIGTGPTIWTTFGPVALGWGAWLALWLLAELGTRSAESIAVERDVGSGVRLGLLLAVNGLILGRAVAGDWVSAAATGHDFLVLGWPVLPVTAVFVGLQRLLRPGVERRSAALGAVR